MPARCEAAAKPPAKAVTIAAGQHGKAGASHGVILAARGFVRTCSASYTTTEAA